MQTEINKVKTKLTKLLKLAECGAASTGAASGSEIARNEGRADGRNYEATRPNATGKIA